jgi:ribose/xylose/arabinose/galactoside ABC-type transport system permease subunit
MSETSPSNPHPTPTPGSGSNELAIVPFSTTAMMKSWVDLFGPLIALLGIFLLFMGLVGTSFASFDNIQSILRQSTVTCAAALGATFIIISAGIDLSVGSAVALAAMLIAQILSLAHHADPTDPDNPVLWLDVYPVLWPLFAAGCGIGVGLLAGLFNGVLITRLKLAPFIVTLGSMMIFRGLTEAISTSAVNTNKNWVRNIINPAVLPTWLHDSLHDPKGLHDSHWKWLLEWFYLAPGLWIVLGLAVICALVLKYFRFGRHVIAIGSNEQTARLCGIPVNRNKIYIYLIGGFFAGVAGIMQYAWQKQGSPTADVGLELDVIAAVVIGGASLNGGKGTILGTIVGSLIMTVIAIGLLRVPIPTWFPERLGQGIGLSSFVQKIVTGCIIIIAVALDNLRQRKPT